MKKNNSVLMLSAEMYPFRKRGGLGDVIGALPQALISEGVNVKVLLPWYPDLDGTSYRLISEENEFGLYAINNLPKHYSLRQSTEMDFVYFIYCPALFSREDIYASYDDDFSRWLAFGIAALNFARDSKLENFQEYILHAHDWHSAAAIFLRNIWKAKFPTLFTIHNLAYQGNFPFSQWQSYNLDSDHLLSQTGEFHRNFSFMKAAILNSDRVSTVSPNYAKEILTPEFGCGMHPYLSSLIKLPCGILNGLDFSNWNPDTDKYLSATYNRNDWEQKLFNKGALQKHFKLPQKKNVLLIGMITRLVEQKGLNLVVDILEKLFSMNIQIVILGSGEAHLEQRLKQNQKKYSGSMGVEIAYHDELAHKIEAGADLFLMPSRYEPCGLNQIYSLSYGTLPLVRSVGGLQDTVQDVDASKNGTGFKFNEFKSSALLETIERAYKLFTEDKSKWRTIAKRAMSLSSLFNWEKAALEYKKIYEELY